MRTLLFIVILVLVLGIAWAATSSFLANRAPKAARLKSEEKNELLSLRQMKENIQLGVGESGEEHAVAIVLDEIRQHSARMRELNS